ncbi:MAG TPA: hypothetical protein VM032_16390 [Vicinamibacterales bacterium]|nr:hypothetical protein [Vicinamibacterales bacterium]
MTTEEPGPQDVVEQLAARKADAVNTLEMLRAQRARVVEESAKFESPQAVLDYVDFFIPAIEEVIVAIDRISGEILIRVKREHIDLLRQIAANCRVEQRRCLVFRDKCINRPLPNEAMRPLLNDISVTTRDQLTAFYDLNNAAARLERIIGTAEPEPDPRRVLGRRQLFTSLFKLPKD